MRAIAINPNLYLEVSITTEEILADLAYPEPLAAAPGSVR